jgi:polysaccharide biosynthesis transport protein
VVVNGIGSRDARGYGQFAAAEGDYNRGPFYQYAYGYSYGTGSDDFYNVYHSEESGSKPKGRDRVLSPET